MKPYYEDKWVKIFHGDCREILPALDVKVDLVLTDPPYLNFNTDHGKEWEQTDISLLILPDVRQLIFWDVFGYFPFGYSAIHIWWKTNSQSAHRYERIFERNGRKTCKVFGVGTINSVVSAQMLKDKFYNHPTQKPRLLIEQLVEMASSEDGAILDPFLGSGTTCYCAKKLNRYSIGIEIEEKYCEIAAKRCSQEVMELNI
jgi:site-specific DNA-methyltransferase (adenine-specific)